MEVFLDLLSDYNYEHVLAFKKPEGGGWHDESGAHS